MANFTCFAVFQSFPTKAVQNASEWPMSPISKLFQSFPTEVVNNDLEQLVSPILQLFQSFPTNVVQNDLEYQCHPFCNFSDLFRTQNGQFHPFHNFSNLFLQKWHRMIQNSQCCPVCNFQSFLTDVVQNNSEWPISTIFATFPIFSH